MVWGQTATRGIEDLVKRIADNDPKLTSLHLLKQRRFNEQDVEALCAALATNTALTELHAASHPLSTHSTAALGAMLATNRGLTALCLGDSGFGNAGVQGLVQGLSQNRTLTRLDLEGKGIGPTGASALAEVLPGDCGIRHLVLAQNPLGDAGISALSAAKWASLRQLELQHCNIGPEGLTALATALGTCRIVSLRLTANPLGPDSGLALQQLLTRATELEQLYLNETELGDTAGAALCAALPAAAALKALDLGECGLGSDTGAALAGVLFRGVTLHSLNLATNPALGDNQVTAIGQALTLGGSPCLASLDLSGCKAGPQSLSALSQARGLTALNLLASPLGDGGAMELAVCLEAGGFAGLKELGISGCGISLQGAEGLFDRLSLGAAPCLESLEMGANPATQHDAFPAQVEALRAARPGLQLHWRSGDQQGAPAEASAG